MTEPDEEFTSAFREVVGDAVQDGTIHDLNLFVLERGTAWPVLRVDRIRVRFGEDNGEGPGIRVPPGFAVSFFHGVLTFVFEVPES